MHQLYFVFQRYDIGENAKIRQPPPALAQPDHPQNYLLYSYLCQYHHHRQTPPSLAYGVVWLVFFSTPQNHTNPETMDVCRRPVALYAQHEVISTERQVLLGSFAGPKPRAY